MEDVDIAIVGAGGAGLTAALYASRARRRTVVFAGGVTGGQIATTDLVENFPGFPDGVNGFDLAQNMLKQAEKFGAELRYDEASGLERLADGRFRVESAAGAVRTRALIVAAGAEYRKLGVPGEGDWVGRGVSYCATCDAAFFKDMDVAVVGGGDAAIDEGLFTTRYARSVTVIHRREELRASKVLQERAFANPKMAFLWNSAVEAIHGDAEGGVTGATVRDLKSGKVEEMPLSAVFIFIGQIPNNLLLQGKVDLDPTGHALVDLDMSTNVPGLFVPGDLRARAARQLISACGDGATAAIAAEHWLSADGN